MTNQPKRIWIDAKHGQHPDDWGFYVEGDITAKDHRKMGRLPYVPEANLTALLRAEYERGKAEANALWSHNSRETFEAMCAMRDAINEHVPMPSLESDLLQGPEASVFCAAVAEAVIGALATQDGR